jgi:lipopolysaccharide/colanic/teichoic acid biosynthesis glycosyltransferase
MIHRVGSTQAVPADSIARKRSNFEMLLGSVAVLFAVLVLPVGYAAVLPHVERGTLMNIAFSMPVWFPAAANAFVMLLSTRLKGRFDRKLAASLGRAVFVHGALAMSILLARLDYSNQIMVLATAVSMIGGPLVVWLSHDAYPPRVALLCPKAPPSLGQQHLDCGVERVRTPSADLTGFDLILTPDIATLPPQWAIAVSRAMVHGTPVRHLADYVEERRGLVCVDHFDPEHLPAGGLTSYRTRKRLLDLFLVGAILPIALPVLAVSALAVLLTMGRPILFVQDRVGLGGKSFKMLKLRTMRPAAVGAAAAATDAANSVRITPVGRFLRKYRIDELPQLFNVLVGNMSVVGPRPEWKVLSDAYREKFPVYSYRTLVRPGITGWAQVRSGYAADLEETRMKVGYDLFYIKNFSFALDVQILVRTIWTLVSAFGAR